MLQAMLAGHPNIFTFPESHFFHKIRGRLGNWPIRSAVSPRAATRSLDALLASVELETRPNVPRWWPGLGWYGRSFRAIVDEATQARGLDLWIDKSPIHLHYIEEIRQAIPGAKFVHLLRDGRDVVASLLEASRREPDRWIPQLLPRAKGNPNRDRLIDASTARWNEDLQRTLARLSDRDHYILVYEELLDMPQAALAALCDFLGVGFASSMIQHHDSARDVVGWRGDLPHMALVFHPLEDRRLIRFQGLPEEEQMRIVANLDHAGDPRAALRAVQDG